MSEKYKQYDIVDIMKGGSAKKSAKVTGNQSAKVTDNQSAKVTDNQSAQVTDNQSAQVTDNQSAQVTGNQSAEEIEKKLAETIIETSNPNIPKDVSVVINREKFDLSLNQSVKDIYLTLDQKKTQKTELEGLTSSYKDEYQKKKEIVDENNLNYTRERNTFIDNIIKNQKYIDLNTELKYVSRSLANFERRKKEIEGTENTSITRTDTTGKSIQELSDLINVEVKKKKELDEQIQTFIDEYYKSVDELLPGIVIPDVPADGSDVLLNENISSLVQPKTIFQPTESEKEKIVLIQILLEKYRYTEKVLNKQKEKGQNILDQISKFSEARKAEFNQANLFYEDTEKKYRLAEYHSGTLDIYADEGSNDQLKAVKDFRDSVKKVKDEIEAMKIIAEELKEEIKKIIDGADGKEFVDSKTAIKTSYSAFFELVSTTKNTYETSVDIEKTNNDLLTAINTRDDIKITDPFIKEILNQFKTLLLIGNDIDKLTKEIMAQRYNNIFEGNLKTSIVKIQRQIAILDMNVIRIKLKELKTFKESLLDKRKISLYDQKVTSLEAELEKAKSRADTSQKEVDDMTNELKELRKYKKTLNYVMSDLIDKYTKNLEKVNEVLNMEGIEQQKEAENQKKLSEKVQFDQLDVLIQDITESQRDEQIKVFEEEIKKITQVQTQNGGILVGGGNKQTNKQTSTTNKKATNKKETKATEENQTKDKSKPGTVTIDEETKTYIENVHKSMSIFNKKEFHLLFTIMSDEEYFNLLCQKIIVSTKELVQIILNSVFAETNGLSGITGEKKDKDYYSLYMDYLNINDPNSKDLIPYGFISDPSNNLVRSNGTKFKPFTSILPTDITNATEEIKDMGKYVERITTPLFLPRYVEQVYKSPTSTGYVKFQFDKYKVLELVHSFLARPGVFKHLNIIYNMLIKKICPIYTFLKIRQDSAEPNPRYVVKQNIEIKEAYDENNTDPNDTALIIKYWNSDVKVLYDGPKNDGTVKSEDFTKLKADAGGKQETYYIGPITGYFPASSNNNTIAKNIAIYKNITTKLLNFQNVIVIGNGQSGSGKTSTLVFLNKNGGQEGIIPIMCNGKEMLAKFDRLTVRAVEVYVKYDATIENYSDIKENHYFVQNLRYEDSDIDSQNSSTPNTDYKFVQYQYTDGNGWGMDPSKKFAAEPDPLNPVPLAQIGTTVSLGKFIDTMLTRRVIGPTKNNPESSRSHVLVLLEFKQRDGTNTSKMVISDLAGVEDRFTCNVADLITAFNRMKTGNNYYVANQKIQLDNNVAKCEYVNLGSKANFEIDQTGGADPAEEEFDEFNKYKELAQINPKKMREAIETNTSGVKAAKYESTTEYDFIFDVIKNPTNEEDFENLEKIMVKYAQAYPYDNLDSRSFIDTFFGTTKLNLWAEFSGMESAKIGELSSNKNLKILLEYLLYNCLMRRYEGYIINQSLGEMRKLITNLTFQVVKEKLMKKQNPLFFLVPNVYLGNVYCYGDNYQNDNNYQYFTGDNTFTPNNSILFKIIFGTGNVGNKNLKNCSSDIVKGFSFDTNKTSISLMTIINLSKGTTNNPPNPPFININKLKQIINILKYFKQIQEARPDFYKDPTNFDSIFKPVLLEIKNYLIGKFKKPEDIIGESTPDAARKELSGVIDSWLEKLPEKMVDREKMKEIETKEREKREQEKKEKKGSSLNINLPIRKPSNIYKAGTRYNTREFNINTENGDMTFRLTSPGPDDKLTEASLIEIRKTYQIPGITEANATKAAILKACTGFTLLSVNYLGTVKQIPKEILFKTEEGQDYKLSHFRKIAKRYKFIKNAFSSKAKKLDYTLKYLYSEEILKANQTKKARGRTKTTVGTAQYVYEQFVKYSEITSAPDDKTKPGTLTKLIELSEGIKEVIESSNPATLIGTVDFQEYTQFRDTEKLYMTCDGKNNSWQINPIANSEFETQPLPQQLKGGSNDLFDWIDINI